MKHISDSERLTRAILNQKEQQLKKSQETIDEYREQLLTMAENITDLKRVNAVLISQVKYLSSKNRSSCPN